jgi:hypothetical protein
MAGTGPRAVLERLVDDEYVQEQLGAGVARLRAAYRRAHTLHAHEAVQDEKLYDHVRGAAAGLYEAGRRAVGMPQPDPKPRWRRLPVLVVALGVAGLVWDMHRAQRDGARPSALA